jgi:hypothetical protein
MAKPYFTEISGITQAALSLPLTDIDDSIADYNGKCLYELEKIDKKRTITARLNEYSAAINIYYTTKATAEHQTKAMILLAALQNYDARSIISMETIRLIINASEYLATKFSLVFENINIP